MKNELGKMKGEKLIKAIQTGEILVDRSTNHGKEFWGPREKQHKKIFHEYLGSCARYLNNKSIEEPKYHG